MKKRTAVAAIGGAGVIAVGASVVPALATTSATTHTLRFTAVTQSQKFLSHTAFGEDEKDIKNGKIIGYDVIDAISASPTSTNAAGRLAFASKQGILYGTLNLNNSGTTHGKVVGGTGAFKGATGTIVGKDLNSAGTRTSVTVKWHN